MEEKKRKKAKKKQNRSGQHAEAAANAVPSPSVESPDVVSSDREGHAAAVVEAAVPVPFPEVILSSDREGDSVLAAEGQRNGPSVVLKENLLHPLVELQQIIQELKSAFDSEARYSPAFTSLIDDIKTSHATSQANLDYLIEQLRGEIFQLNLAANSQKNKEVDLEGDIQHLREEMSHLKVIQQIEREKKVAENIEIHQLREEVAKLSEGSIKQLRMVEEMGDIMRQLLKNAQSPPLMSSSQLVRNSTVCTAVASEAEVLLSSELLKVNGHHVLLNHSDQLESNINKQSTQTKSFDTEQIGRSSSSADPPCLEEHMGACGAEVLATYVEGQMLQKEPVDESDLFVDNTAVTEVRQEVDDAHQEFIPEMSHFGSPSHAHMQANDLKPLSDAPITGAPIRLFRFVARYVSGADLAK